MASSLLDVCRFNPTLGGTTDWTYSSAVTGYQSPVAAGAVNGATYSYRAESADFTQWEVGFGTINTGTGVLARSTVLFNSAGTTAKISFSAAPQVAIVALAEDIVRGQTGHIPGEPSNGSAAAGEIGEYTTSTIVSASGVTLASSGTVSNVTSISLTAGDWDISIQGYYGPSSVTAVAFASIGLSLTSATIDVTEGRFAQLAGMGSPSADFGLAVTPYRLSLSATTTVYFIARSSYTGTSIKCYGIIRARRMR
jgi:hypothetical protein